MASAQSGDVEFNSGLCAGHTLPGEIAYYQWTQNPPQAGSDFYHLHYVTDDNQETVDADFSPDVLVGKNCGCGGESGNSSLSSVSTSPPATPFTQDPINIANGDVFYGATDYHTAGANQLTFSRYYNSEPLVNSHAASLGANWRSEYDRYITTLSAASAVAERMDGRVINFKLVGSRWTGDADITLTLAHAGSTWTLTDANNTVETYTDAGGGKAYLTSIKSTGGYMRQLVYNSSRQLTSVTDSYGRKLGFTYKGALISNVTVPDNDVALAFTYSSSAVMAGVSDQLASATLNNAAQSYAVNYAYTPFSTNLTTVTAGNVVTTFTYDGIGRGLSSQIGNDLTTVMYNDNDGSRVVTNALGQAVQYNFAFVQGSPKMIGMARIATGTTAAATESVSYDANGYLASVTDWNGNVTKYINNNLGQPTSIVEASGTPVARTTTISYDGTFTNLPSRIVTAGMTKALSYDLNGNVVSMVLTDTTTTILPYSTNGQTRRWSYTYSNALLTSVASPIGNITTLGYASNGTLISVTNALGQKTAVLSATGGGYPTGLLDMNHVGISAAYDGRRSVAQNAIVTSAGNLVTKFAYTDVGDLQKMTLPDASSFTRSYNSQELVTQLFDSDPGQVNLAYDAHGDLTAKSIRNAMNATTWSHSATFDALGRMFMSTGGAGQQKFWLYDNDGNATIMFDGLAHTTRRTFDALNRVSTTTDANAGVVGVTYDSHDRPLTLRDPNGNTTSFVYNGFGNVLQQVSPDSGTTVYRYDADGNLVSKLDGVKTVTNQTFDKLDRVLTTRYPADATLNVTYTYDQSGFPYGFGVGKLTSVTDAAGSLVRGYDERGNLLGERRVRGSVTLTTRYSYDVDSRLASITYPSGTLVTYGRDAAGRITSVASKAASALAATNVVSAVTYDPFGPMIGMKYGNGVVDTRMYDLDYRPIGIADVGNAAFQRLTYAYDVDDNVKSITDAVHSANSQSFAYDTLNRLTSASAGSGGYGSLSWTYDRTGNLSRSTSSVPVSSAIALTYAPNSNRLASALANGTTISIATNADGNITSIPPENNGTKSATFTYSKANRLAAVAGSPVSASFVYDAFGRRVGKTDSGSPPVYYTYAQDGTLLEEDNVPFSATSSKSLVGSSARATIAIRTPVRPARLASTALVVNDHIYLDGVPVASLAATTATYSYILTDNIGTPTAATNNTDALVWSSERRPYGVATTTGSISQNLRFPGQSFDSETGFNHNGFRDYMPNIGRYLEADPVGLKGGVNAYVYANANPQTFVDSAGLEPEAWVAAYLLAELFAESQYFRDLSQWYQSQSDGGAQNAGSFVFDPFDPYFWDRFNDSPMFYGSDRSCSVKDPFGRDFSRGNELEPEREQSQPLNPAGPEEPNDQEPPERFKLVPPRRVPIRVLPSIPYE